jgi:hypothetical protein
MGGASSPVLLVHLSNSSSKCNHKKTTVPSHTPAYCHLDLPSGICEEPTFSKAGQVVKTVVTHQASTYSYDDLRKVIEAGTA